jgi:hypothetical protein
MAGSSIEWTASDDGSPARVWNPTTGCDKISPSCGLPRFGGDAAGAIYVGRALFLVRAGLIASRSHEVRPPKMPHAGPVPSRVSAACRH